MNGILLHDPKTEAGWWDFPLNPGKMAVGRNLLSVDGGVFDNRTSPVTLENVEIHVKYRPEKNTR